MIKNWESFNESKKSKVPNLDKIRKICQDLEDQDIIQGEWNLNEDGSVDVDGNVVFSDDEYTSIPNKFGRVTGTFNISGTKIKSLENSPYWVGGDFDCSSCESLKNLKGGPTQVCGDLLCDGTWLSSLEGSPRIIGGKMEVYDTEIKNFKGGPNEIGGDILAWSCKITSLEGLPENFNGKVDVSRNHLSTLKGLPKFVSSLLVPYNSLTKLDGCPIVLENFDCSNNKLKSLEGSPQQVTGDMECAHNKLKNLKGAPEDVGDYFLCNSNQLTSWEGIPKQIGGELVSSENPDLYDPKFYPESVGGIDVDDCPIDEVFDIFQKDEEQFLDSMVYNYIQGNKIIKFKLEEACNEFDIEIPNYVWGYEIIDTPKPKKRKK